MVPSSLLPPRARTTQTILGIRYKQRKRAQYTAAVDSFYYDDINGRILYERRHNGAITVKLSGVKTKRTCKKLSVFVARGKENTRH